ncbi:MAG: DUF2304 domain-containing protein [candidate division KSB1 bacterium]|nr:DUF2304 domain-containing protein [candidate division KSB1 bacterium]
MNARIQLFAVAGALLVMALIFELIRKRKLLEEYSLLWFVAAVALLILAIWRDLLEILARVMGIYYAPSALFLIALFFGVVLFLHFTLVISKLTRRTTRLTQEIGLLRAELEELRARTLGSPAEPEPGDSPDLP